MQAECPCGAVLEAAAGPTIRRLVQEHARAVHHRDLDDEQVQAMIRPA
jgi:hypothetical protein